MRYKNKLINTILFLSVFTMLSSCNGQGTSENITKTVEFSAIGTPVSKMETNPMTIFQDSQDNYWFGGSDEGVYKYDNKGLVLYTTEDGLSGNSVLGIQEDKFGNIFFDSEEGVSKFDGQKFTILDVVDNNSSDNDGSLNDTWELNPDDLWFRMGWGHNGPFRYDGESLYYLEFPKTVKGYKFYEEYPNSSYSPYGIYFMYKDSKGMLWFGTASLGVCRYDGESLSWLYEKQLTKTENGGDFGIRSIIEDKDENFWFCNTRHQYTISSEITSRKGESLIKYTTENGIGYSNEQGETEFPFFMSIAEDNDGDLWMATYGDGVWRNDGETLIHYPIKDGDTDVLLFSIYKDNEGILWLTSHNAGVYKYNGSEFEKFEP